MAEKLANTSADKNKQDSGTELPDYLRGYVDAGQEKIKKKLAEEVKKEISDRADKISQEIKSDLQEYISRNQTRIIEALAIFVALFTFISINIQIFTKTQDLFSATIFMILMAFLSMVMISFPIILLRSRKDDKMPKWALLILISSILLFLIVFILSSKLHIPLNIKE
jgi:predicted PurR-regulated permease PerM